MKIKNHAESGVETLAIKTKFIHITMQTKVVSSWFLSFAKKQKQI